MSPNALGLTTLSVVVGGSSALLSADLFSNPSPFLWPVLALGGTLFALVLAKAFQLWVKRDHVAPGRGLGVILLTAGATLMGWLKALEDNRDLINIGAYVPGSDPVLDRALEKEQEIREFLTQPCDTGCAVDDTMAGLRRLTGAGP